MTDIVDVQPVDLVEVEPDDTELAGPPDDVQEDA